MDHIQDDKLKVSVHYMAAREPFKEDAERNETVGSLNQKVLAFFKLSDGGNTNYVLYHDKAALENMNQTLGELAGDKKVLELKLAQQVTQGL